MYKKLIKENATIFIEVTLKQIIAAIFTADSASIKTVDIGSPDSLLIVTGVKDSVDSSKEEYEAAARLVYLLEK